jgi:DnaD/phage-associated family protein
MAILRVNKTKDYTTMSNYHFKDKRLSLKAKGLLSEMLSLPDDWDYSIAGLVAINKEKETSIISTLDELKQCNYLVVTKLMPNETESGRYEYIYDIYEIPRNNVEKQEGDFLGVDFQGLENIGLYKYTDNKITDNKEEIIKEENIFDYYQNEIGELSPRQYELINTYIEKYGEEKIKDAINISVDNGVRTFNYFRSVLTNDNYKSKKEIDTPEWMGKQFDYEQVTDEELKELEEEFGDLFD